MYKLLFVCFSFMLLVLIENKHTEKRYDTVGLQQRLSANAVVFAFILVTNQYFHNKYIL